MKTMIIFWVIVIVGSAGYISNIVKLCKCDFEKPMTAEVIRATGIFIPPVGAVVGYLRINGE